MGVRVCDKNGASSVDHVYLYDQSVPAREAGVGQFVQVTSKEDDQMESYRMGHVSI